MTFIQYLLEESVSIEGNLRSPTVPAAPLRRCYEGYHGFNGRTVEDDMMKMVTSTRESAFTVHETCPAIVHRIWLTDPENPHDPAVSHGELTLELNVVSFGSKWRHIIWTNCVQALSRMESMYKEAGLHVEIKHYADETTDPVWRPLIDRLIADKKFVTASDLLRLQVLYEYGGIYCDMGVGFKTIADQINCCFDYGFLFWPPEKIFQNSFLMMPKGNPVSATMRELVLDHYLFPAYFHDGTASLHGYMELSLFGAHMITALALLCLPDKYRIALLMPNQRLVRWKAHQSWYLTGERKTGLYGNTIVVQAPPSFLEQGLWKNRNGRIFDIALKIANSIDSK